MIPEKILLTKNCSCIPTKYKFDNVYQQDKL